MNTLLEDLYNERAELLERLREIDAALRLHDMPAVEIQCHRNIRNTGWLTCNPTYAIESPRMVLVYTDNTLTETAEPAAYRGWISGPSAAKLQAAGLEGIEIL